MPINTNDHTTSKVSNRDNVVVGLNSQLLNDIKSFIDQSKTQVCRKINAEMIMLYWHIGRRINDEVLKDERAEYGEQIIMSLAKSLFAEYGRGFTRTALIRMIQFYQQFSDFQISSAVSSQLSWSHIIELLPISDSKGREFYLYMTTQENWSVRELRSKIHKMTYERTNYGKSLDQAQLLPNLLKPKASVDSALVLKDPYILDFLGLPDEYQESDLESAILKEIERFILELGAGFSFVARQKRMTVENEHFYLDLLFFNRKLHRLVAIELKTSKFKPEYKGQMELYLNWLKKYECFDGENSPIGIILCSEKSRAQIELLDLSHSDIHVAEYWTELPPIDIFERKLQEIVLQEKIRLENK